MNDIKAVFFDFDWTLFDHKTRTLIPSAIESINKIQQQGVKVFINSARSYYSLEGLGVFNKIHFDGFVTSNGGACLLKNKDIYAHVLSKTKIDKIIKICDEHKISYMIQTKKHSYIKEYDLTMIKAFYNVFYEAYALPIDSFKGDEEILIIQTFCDSTKDYLFEDIEEVSRNRFCEWVIEFSSKEFIKSEGIKAILNEFNFKESEIAAFGDDVNDIDMFDLVKYSICMGNGKKAAKEHASYITTNIEEDGIKNGLIYLGLIK